VTELVQGSSAAARAALGGFDRLRFEAKYRLGLISPLEVLPYRGHGTPRELFLKGRVLEDEGITRSGQHDPAWKNVLNMVRRFASDEVPGARVRATFGGRSVEAIADVEGFFDVRFELEEPISGPTAWHPVEVELMFPRSPDGRRVRSTGQVLVPQGARLGVISDIDDTVVRSSATNALKMAWIVLLNNAYDRLPFEGIAAFYEALRRGPGGDEYNPIFYVSSSPWNIYDVIEDFLDVHDVPVGPIFLKDWSLGVLGKHEDHKLGLIRTLLATYPEMEFVLIGDSGQEDPEIYLRAAREHPGRIRAIYVRDVNPSIATEGRDTEVLRIAAEARSLGVEMVLVPDTATAARHAQRLGLIAPESVPRISPRSA
jgi:phosphatidate phosphatase APP1